MTRYACPTVDSIWTEEAKLARWLRVWGVCGVATGHPLPATLKTHAGGRAWFLEAVEDRERVTGHDVQAALDVLRGHLLQVYGDQDGSGSGSWLHFGLCSSDVVDAGWLLGISASTTELNRLLNRTNQALRALAGDLDGRDALYRTHGRAAQVQPASNRWWGHEQTLLTGLHAMYAAMPNTVGFNGPTGNGGALTLDERARIARDLGLQLSAPNGYQAADRTEWARWLRCVVDLATVCERVATDVRLLSIEEVGEVTEGRATGYVGSSSMPHKSRAGVSNPTQSERICGIAAVVRGLANGYAEACSSIWGSHSLEHSSADRLCIPQVTGLVGYVLEQTTKVITELVVDTKTAESNWYNAQCSGDVTSYEDRARQLRPLAPTQDDAADQDHGHQED